MMGAAQQRTGGDRRAGGAIRSLADVAATLAVMPLDFELPAGAIVLDRRELDGRAGRWLDRWLERAKAGEPVAILVAIDNSHALAVARPGPTRPLGARQLELEL